MDDIQQLERWLSPLLQKLSPAECKALAGQVARHLRASNAATMKAQQAPDGTAWEPRKPAELRDGRGAVRRKVKPARMFQKLRTTKHLKAQGLAEEAVLEFVGRTERIARVHHFGLEDRVTPGGPLYRYPARPLLGITPAQMEQVSELVLSHLSP